MADAYWKSLTSELSEQAAFRSSMIAMCKGLKLVASDLPSVARGALNCALNYWVQDCGDNADLAVAREMCWQFLDKKGRSIAIVDREDISLRALLCVLYAEPISEDFISENFHWFVSMLNRFGDFEEMEQVVRLATLGGQTTNTP